MSSFRHTDRQKHFGRFFLAIAAVFVMAQTATAQIQPNQGGYQFAPSGELYQGGRAVEQTDAFRQAHTYPHQDQHTLTNSAFTVITSTGVSNSADPGYIQPDQAALEGSADAIVGGNRRTASILYVDQNPYTNGGTAQNQANYTTFDLLLLNAQSNYTPVAALDGITYLTHNGAGSDRSLVGTVRRRAPLTTNFQNAQINSNGTGAVITSITQSASAVAHLENLRQVAGSNMYASFFVRQGQSTSGSSNRRGDPIYAYNSYQGEVVLNSAFNHNAALNLDNYARFNEAAAVANDQSQQYGAEIGFYVNREGTIQGIDGVANRKFIMAKYNPNAILSAHTH